MTQATLPAELVEKSKMFKRQKQKLAELGLLSPAECAAKWGLTTKQIIDRCATRKVPAERLMNLYYGIAPDVDPRTPREKRLQREEIEAEQAERQDKRYHKRERDKRSISSSAI